MNYPVVHLNAGSFQFAECFEANNTKYFKLIHYPCIAEKKALENQDDAFIHCNQEGIWLVY